MTSRRPSKRAGAHTGVSFDLGPEGRISGLDEPGPGHGPEVAQAQHAVSQANFLACHQFDRWKPRSKRRQGDD